MARRYRYEYLQRKRAKQSAEGRQRIKQHIEKREAHNNGRQVYKYRRKRRKRNKRIREIKIWIMCALIILISAILFNTFLGQLVRVSGDSMIPTLHNGDILFVDKLSINFKEIERFEIVVFPHHEKRGYYIKRVIGLPGETVQIIEGAIYINGKEMEEPYIVPAIDEEMRGIARNPVKLGNDEYFVLGDNRNNSLDSRSTEIGILRKEDFSGKARVRIWASGVLGKIAP